jgi:integrase
VRNGKHRTIILTAYAAGLRLSELLHLRVTDIAATRRTIRVQQGKGGQDRYTVLSAHLLEALRGYWNAPRPAPP